MRRCIRCGQEITNGNKKFCSIICRKKGRIKINCAFCGKVFETVESNAGAKYCSLDCKSKSQQHRIRCVCVVCGKEYTVFHAYNEGKGSSFCSQKCKSSQKIEKVCYFCGNTFLVKPSQKSQKHCSRICQVKNGDKDRIRVCKLCGKKFMVKYPSSTKHFCSSVCFKKNKRKEENHYIVKCMTCGKLFETTIYANNKYCSKKCYLNNNGTSYTELLLKDALESLGFVHQYKYKLGHADYVNKDKKIVVFVDGAFWHGREDKRKHWVGTKMEPNIRRAVDRDKEQTKYFEERGWVVLRFWDDYVRENTDGCVAEITNFIVSSSR